ncbi:4Fe-4S binding protein [uncultured Maritimibacter sp.]|jgi:transcriptional regulator of nitric oxide reductase/ferredoxin|uniref:4Fe-4S binding protein n=1 Tax=uncultured Maritimibacter sp. TaxID=991866 RepID=UPI000B0352FD|nr:4Fe-4S binding protein [uncultured Maritimibacter sp.]
MWRIIVGFCLLAACLAVSPARAADWPPADRATIEALIVPPYALGEAMEEPGVYHLLNSGGAEIGYAFETGPLAPLPGFSGKPIDIVVLLTLDGTIIDVRLISQNEPVFVSGLGEAPFREFLAQYPGLSITQPLVVGVPYGKGASGSDLVYLDGVTKATASVRIAHESILAAALQVVRDKMGGMAGGAPSRPDMTLEETLTWDDLVDEGIARRLTVTNAEVDAAFSGTVWADDDPEAEADPAGLFLDLWLVDIGAPAVQRAILQPETVEELAGQYAVSPDDEPLLVMDAGRHGLVSPDFVRNTAPDRLSAEQGGFPVALRDADMFPSFLDSVPDHETAMILRADRRLGFDPITEWTLKVQAVREHGMFQPEVGDAHFNLEYVAPARFYVTPEVVKPRPAWLEAIVNRQTDLAILSVFLVGLLVAVGPGMHWLAARRHYTAIRLGILAVVVGFVGYWGQGQLSIVTVLAVLRAAVGDGSFAVLLYDPFSLLIWAVTIPGFVLWGRGLFCGWLCPFGAMQEFAHHLGRLLRLPQIEPGPRLDAWLKRFKYVALAVLIAVAFILPDRAEKAAEIEPFKTAITVGFQREWFYGAYAFGWLVLGTVFFKGFCRYVCPLGAFMAIGGLLRGRKWIDRRAECGSPCQLCRVKCQYGAIKKTGEIQYDECFQCLDCVTIYDDPKKCVPLIIEEKRGRRQAA